MATKKRHKKKTDLKIGNTVLENIQWEDLEKDTLELTKQLNYYTQTVKLISKDKKLASVVNGFSKSILDLVKSYTETRNKHMDDTIGGLISKKKGVITEEQDIYTYFNIKNAYVAYFETLNNLVQHLFIDIMTSIKTANNKNIVEDAIEDINALSVNIK